MSEKKLLAKLAKWGRRSDRIGQAVNPLIVLTGKELFFNLVPRQAAWKESGPPHDKFADFQHIRNLTNFADATQQIYLDLPPLHVQRSEERKKRHARRGDHKQEPVAKKENALWQEETRGSNASASACYAALKGAKEGEFNRTCGRQIFLRIAWNLTPTSSRLHLPPMPLSTLTFGCRLNAAESAAMFLRATEAGLDDAILVNTCAVTAEAVRQARQAIRKARRENPGKKIVVSGCAAQTEPEIFARMPEVDLVLGNEEKLHAESYRRLNGSGHGADRLDRNTDVVIAGLDPAIHSVTSSEGRDRSGMDARIKSGHDDIWRGELARSPTSASPPPKKSSSATSSPYARPLRISPTASPPPMTAAARSRARAFVQVQNGCDHRCTFCIIPYGRGNSRSVPMGAVVDAVRRLVERGVPEIVLTGVDITAYGADLPGRPKLGGLVRKILKHVPELPRLRLSSIDSVEADPELLRAVAEEERLMPHLHLSLQSGDDMILKRMKRRHSRADAIRFCDEVRRLRPDIVLGADLIAGFPTETDAMFENTLSLVDACGLTFLHVFPFSARPGTPAARMPQTDRRLVQTRAQTVRQQGHSALMARFSDEIGTVRQVLVETPKFGRAENYLPVTFDTAEPGRVVSVRISAAGDKSLSGHVIRAAA